jgi:tetratricopeptide (TPR) repeat protein
MQTRAFQISVLIFILFAIVCTRIPLFNYLGFEFSALTVVLAGFVGGLLTLSLWKQTDCECKADVWQFVGKIAFVQCILLAIPFLISLANVLFVKNCSIGDGMALYALTVLPGVLFSAALAMVVGILAAKWRKTLFTILYILVLLHIPLVTFFYPQIFAFNPILGFFPGFTYDETLQVTQRLLIYRLATFASFGCLVTTTVWIWHIRFYRKERKNVSQQSFPFMEIIILALLVPIVLMMLSFSDRLGFSSSQQYIQQKLVGNYKTAHFEIIYPAGSVKREQIEQLGRLHEYYYSKLSHDLDVQSQERIVSFLYSSPEEKGKLIGAGRTDIAKPWLRQIHINLTDVEAGLKHEMAHILAGEFGWSPLKISHNSGLVEGIAVAVGDDVYYNEPLDRASALVFAAGVNPDMESLFSFSGFAKVNSGVSYVLAGSFCKFLIDSFGIDQFKKLYRSGDFLLTYNRPLPSLLMDWRAIVHRQQFTADDSVKAQYLFRRSSIFGKECARVIANVNSETRELLTRHEFEKALTSAERSLGLSKTPDAVFQKSSALFELRRFKDAADFIETQLRDTSFGSALLPLHLRFGDVYWAMDSLVHAKQEYELMARFHLNAWYEEACILRLESLKNEQDRSELRVHFTYSMEDTVRMARLSKLSSPLAQYLLARELAGKEKYREACSILEHIRSSDIEPLKFFYLQRLGRIYFSLQEWKKAGILFEKALPVAPTRSSEIEIKEWIERCEFESKPPSEGSQSLIK